MVLGNGINPNKNKGKTKIGVGFEALARHSQCNTCNSFREGKILELDGDYSGIFYHCLEGQVLPLFYLPFFF